MKPKFKENQDIRKGFAELRKAITSFVRICADNVEATIEIKEILDSPSIIKAGNGLNGLLITINSRNGVDYK